jgi:hypothetical protein
MCGSIQLIAFNLRHCLIHKCSDVPIHVDTTGDLEEEVGGYL